MSGDAFPLRGDERVQTFARLLATHRTLRVPIEVYWTAFDQAFPHRSVHDERQLLRAVLDAAQEAGWIRLPSARGRLWDTSREPRLPAVIHRVTAGREPRSTDWRTFPWHPRLQWVLSLPALTAEQEGLLRNVHDGLACGAFAEPAPLRHRSLQLTGDEKKLVRMGDQKTLFGPGRLTRELLGCFREPVPFASVDIGPAPDALVVENVGTFYSAVAALRRMNNPRYGLVVHGVGTAFRYSVRYFRELPRTVRLVHYLGDLDAEGIAIAYGAAEIARREGDLPPIVAVPGGVQALLHAAAELGKPDGWPSSAGPLSRVSGGSFLPDAVRDQVLQMIRRGRRIPEEALGVPGWDRLLAGA
jgi:hypothetical protein